MMAWAPEGRDLNMVLTFEASFLMFTLEVATTVSGFGFAGVVVVGGLVEGGAVTTGLVNLFKVAAGMLK